jgi:hypothetical protein
MDDGQAGSVVGESRRRASARSSRRSIVGSALTTKSKASALVTKKAASRRPIQWLHVPVPQHHDDDAYYAPLEGLDLGGGTELYLGLVHLGDDDAAARRKVDAASRHAGDFGVAAACGLGTIVSGVPPDRIPDMLERHRAVADLA